MRWGLAGIVACGCLSKPPPPGGADCDGVDFGAAGPLQGSVLAGKNINDPTLDNDATELWFAYPTQPAGYELFHAVATAGSFDAMTDISGLLSPSNETDPTLTADGLDLMFLSERGGPNVWEATRASRQADFVGPPHGVLLASEPSTAGGIDLSADGLTLYFVGDQDTLYSVTRATRTAAFGMPSQPLAHDTNWISVSADQRELYYTKSGHSTGVYRRVRADLSDTFDMAPEESILAAGGDPDVTPDATTLVMIASGSLVTATRSCP